MSVNVEIDEEKGTGQLYGQIVDAILQSAAVHSLNADPGSLNRVLTTASSSFWLIYRIEYQRFKTPFDFESFPPFGREFPRDDERVDDFFRHHEVSCSYSSSIFRLFFSI